IGHLFPRGAVPAHDQDLGSAVDDPDRPGVAGGGRSHAAESAAGCRTWAGHLLPGGAVPVHDQGLAIAAVTDRPGVAGGGGGHAVESAPGAKGGPPPCGPGRNRARCTRSREAECDQGNARRRRTHHARRVPFHKTCSSPNPVNWTSCTAPAPSVAPGKTPPGQSHTSIYTGIHRRSPIGYHLARRSGSCVTAHLLGRGQATSHAGP